MESTLHASDNLPPATAAFYRHAMETLRRARIPFLVGGAYALERYTGIVRHTKDCDLFLRPEDCPRALDVLGQANYRTELTFPHWLGKAFHGSDMIDLIYSSGNGVATVDDEWFEHAVEGTVFGLSVKLVPAEEMIWSKAFVVERERYDGADIVHLIRSCAQSLAWHRLLRRFGDNWRVLYSHLVLFGFIYPGERSAIPKGVMEELTQRMNGELTTPPPADEHLCQGTLLSREQYLIDVQRWGYEDARKEPRGNMSEADIEHWTDAIGK